MTADTPPTPSPTPDRSTADSPRSRLLQAARALLEREGLDGLTLRAIAREAGVSHGAPLRHFSGLASLLAALSAEGFRQLVAAIDAATTAEPGAEAPSEAGAEARADERLAASGAAYVNFALSNPGVFGVMFRPELCDISDPDYQTAAAGSFQQLVDLVAAAQEEGWHPDVPTDRMAAVLWAQVHGVAQLWLHGALQSVVAPTDLDDLIHLATHLR